MNFLLTNQVHFEGVIQLLGVSQPIVASVWNADLIKQISDVGILIVIGAIMMGFMIKVLNNMLSRDNNLINGFNPKIEAVDSSIRKSKGDIVDALSTHNSRTNQNFQSVKSELEQLVNLTEENNERLLELEKKVSLIEGNYKLVCTLLAHCMRDNKETSLSPEMISELISISSPDINTKKE